MAGFDTCYLKSVPDSELAEVARQEGRILLSKDKDLLKRKMITFGRLVREVTPEKQLCEIIELYGLKQMLQPFSRCLRCNNVLQPVEKQKILDRLEPLTIKYYNSFYMCGRCRNIYWPGSHREKMVTTLNHCLDSHG
jgi:hypothetical protein